MASPAAVDHVMLAGDWINASPPAGASAPRGTTIAVIGIVSGAIGGLLLVRVVGSVVTDVQIPGIVPIVGAAAVLVVARLSHRR